MSSSLSSNGKQPATFCFAYLYDFVFKSIFSRNISTYLRMDAVRSAASRLAWGCIAQCVTHPVVSRMCRIVGTLA